MNHSESNVVQSPIKSSVHLRQEDPQDTWEEDPKGVDGIKQVNFKNELQNQEVIKTGAERLAGEKKTQEDNESKSSV